LHNIATSAANDDNSSDGKLESWMRSNYASAAADGVLQRALRGEAMTAFVDAQSTTDTTHCATCAWAER
jgi:hypothetical protein